MSLPKKDKKFKVKVNVCSFCGAEGRHFDYQCPKNPRNACKDCGSTTHTSLTCPLNRRKPIKTESDKTKSRRVATSRLWFQLNPSDSNGQWLCYLQISPLCRRYLTRSTIRLEHVKSKVRHPELRYEITNIKPACDDCNKVKGSLDLEDLKGISSIRLPDGRVWSDIIH